MTPLLTASRTSNELPIAPEVRTSISRRPPDIFFTFDANLLSSSICGVPAGLALCIFQRNCGACAFTSTEATVVAAPAMPAPLMNSRRFMASSLSFCFQSSRSEHHVRQNQNDLREEIENEY